MVTNLRRPLLALLLVWVTAACSSPTPAGPVRFPSGAAITSITIQGLPAPLLLELPRSVRAGERIPLTVTAALDDGTTGDVKLEAVLWTTTNASVASVESGVLVAQREGEAIIGASLAGEGPATDVAITVRVGALQVIEQRSGVFECGSPPPPCPYEWCPSAGPYWLFPVPRDGVVELLDADNPAWGSPSNYIVRLSATGKRLDYEQLLLPTNSDYRKASVEGGYMYGFYMQGNLGPCGAASARWTRPN